MLSSSVNALLQPNRGPLRSVHSIHVHVVFLLFDGEVSLRKKKSLTQNGTLKFLVLHSNALPADFK